MRNLILTSPQIDSQALHALATGGAMAVRVPGFYHREAAQRIAAAMRESRLFGMYANAPQIGRVGQAYFESLASEAHRAEYERNAVKWIAEMRSICEPFLSPIDKLRLALDESWSPGAQVGSLQGKKMFVGLARIFGKGSGAEPHQDVLAWDAPDSEEAKALTGQLAANIYLAMPSTGGELLVWPHSLSREEYEAARIPGSYGVREACLPCAPVVIQPQEGELILFNSTFVHAVATSDTGDRVTWSCFVGLRGSNQPAMLWS